MARDGERGRGDWKRLGSQDSGPYAEASGDTGPVDIAAVRRDDALIDAISGDGPVQTGTTEEYQLAALLANWRAEILDEPMPAGPDLDTIVAAVNQEIGARQAQIGAQASGRLRLLRPIMGSAAALALIFGGLTAFSYNANPGDPLWRVKEVVFSEQAQSTVVSRADSDMAQAQELINQGRPEQAKALLERASANVSQVNDNDKKDDLQDRWQQVLTSLAKVAPGLATSLMPTPPVQVPVTSQVPVTTLPGATLPPTTVPGTSGGDSTVPTYDPRGLDSTQPGTGPTTLPNTQPGTVPPTQPATGEPSQPQTVPPTAGPTTIAEPPTGAPPATVPPVTQPPVENHPGTVVPTANPVVPTLVPTIPSVPLPGAPR
ncbi:anti-sigma-D factor RsdA [Nocardia sp. NBC_01503]|uniref:anti-sigma-D factor RsdA n=1 Tax=Nocardia sp. NBC_01503 TaxID=2975997 RepID=UPI002E7B3F61|nr:anti-sigma-D factor RsdA [Nocardia sp. NBC_01503]WTL33827.1 anti-sigma-D factor RsdA [Nocardia sp. NBC_01503]